MVKISIGCLFWKTNTPWNGGIRSLPIKSLWLLQNRRRLSKCSLICRSGQIQTCFLWWVLTHVMSISLTLNPRLDGPSVFTRRCQLLIFSGHLSYLFTFYWHHRIADFLGIVLSPVFPLWLIQYYLIIDAWYLFIEWSKIYRCLIPIYWVTQVSVWDLEPPNFSKELQ